MAAVGILIADCADSNVWLFVAGALLCAAGAYLLNRTWLVLACVAFAFAAIHTVRWHGSPARAFAGAFPDGALVEIVGRVVSAPQRGGSGWSSWFMQVERSNPSCPAGIGAGVKVRMDGAAPDYGSLVRVTGILKKIAEPRNPGEFDYAAHLARRDVRCQLEVRAARHLIVLEAPENNWAKFIERCRNAAFKFLGEDLEDSPDIALTIRAVTLGATEDVDDRFVEIFRRSGTLHLFSVSGLHVGMFAVLVHTVLSVLRVPRIGAVGVSIVAIATYVVLSGASSAAVRAGVMSAIVLAGNAGGRTSSLLNSLFAAAFVLMAVDTNQLFDVGFQLSFSAMLGIMAVYQPALAVMRPLISHDPFLPEKLVSPLERTLRHIVLRGVEGCTMSVAAVLGTAIPSWYHFQVITPISVLSNLVVAPFAFCMLALGIASLVSGPVAVGLSAIWNNANWFVTHVVLWCVGIFASVPGGSVHIATHPWKHDGRLAEFLIMDVRRSAATLVRTRDRFALVDTGSPRAYEFVVRNVLAAHGVNGLDALLFTRGDANHYGGGPKVITEFSPRQVIMSRVEDKTRWRQHVREAVVKARIRLAEVAQGDRFEMLPGVHVNVLFPDAALERRTAQDRAMVLLVEVGRWRIMMMSGSGFNTQADMLEQRAMSFRADLLVAGVAEPTVLEEGFVRRVTPAAVLGRVSDALERSPVVQWIDLDQTGALRLVLYPDRIRAEPFLGGGAWDIR